jgi:nitroreductase
MDALQALHTRRSIRHYRNEPVPDDLIQQLLSAAMMAPSARNAQPWHFVVLTDPALLQAAAQINPNAWMTAQAPVGILVCADLHLELSPGYWPVDCAAAVENLLLAAHALGLGAVWTGIYPRQERIDGFRRLLSLPEAIMPHSLVPLGYPAEQPASHDRYRADRVHRDRW